ncbi:hypothetical protein LX15_001121 [Streptoalloteichus tenebrarius]|uniref:MftR C-terminal domain-containing protein n=1 Tax=Streptoalloteichus tenebrarius (strain ATCC 17920 / DSM 40477 / JCM 4838 / CBS 697.72 / NBRC 16177 / NCIMB 11028 / NRRL B-12390 / A12253. 1 / ISP 5477) TaxID=1933 RepID=A0ABT1HPJ1_STRSD|nr:hypothetical protein [Streptoalloteichus tenebrarius]MCP2257436.1 hypothetical protein [Streptoalloteichus tenebrarius]BFE98381.1 hypothetical protein GCM10020241_00570 [Streptoalloteichus tenebrarius]
MAGELHPVAAGLVQGRGEVAARGPAERPSDLLRRALREVGQDSDEIVSRHAALRLRLIRTVPAVRGRALQLLMDAQREIARHLRAAFPDELDQVSASALVGAFVGAVIGAVQALLDDPDVPLDNPQHLHDRLRDATDAALRSWAQHR